MRYEPMSTVDAAWLHMDRPTNLMVVNTLVWSEQPWDQDALRAVLTERLLGRFRRFSQRVDDPVVTAGVLSAPQWVDVDDLALEDHLTVAALPAPGDTAALQEVCGRLASRPLRRDRPLWELHLLTGYDSGNGTGAGLLLRTHHALADGAALMQVLLALTDREDGGAHVGQRPVAQDGRRTAETPVGATAARLAAAGEQARAAAARFGTAALEAATDPRAALGLARQALDDSGMLRKLGFGTVPPRNRLQGPLGADKRLAWTRSVPLAAVKAQGRAAGSTVNDLMLAAVAGALRGYLDEPGSPVGEVAVTVPVDLRPKDGDLPSGLGNDFGLLFVPLPTDESDPQVRRTLVKQRMDRIKGTREGAFLLSMLSLLGQVPAGVQNWWVDVFAGRATAVVTNMAGPAHRVTLAGTPVSGAMAWVPVTGPLGVGLSIVSYAGEVALGLATDAELVVDRDRLLALLDDELEPYRTEG